MHRRRFLRSAAQLAGLAALPVPLRAGAAEGAGGPILVVVELSGGNDGLNTIVPHADDAYYRARPTVGIRAGDLLALDDRYGFNPGMLGMQRLWRDGRVAIVHGCGYERPSYSHFTSMAYWHTGAPHRGDAYGWVGRVADALAAERRDDMVINVASAQSLAVRSRVHTPVVFDEPERFQRHQWMSAPATAALADSGNAAREFLRAVNRSALESSRRIRDAWAGYRTDVDYGVAPMDLPKVAACIEAGLPTQLYYVSFRNNAFDTHVQQPALHQRLLSYACDGVHGFVRDLERIGKAEQVLVLVFSEFGRRVPENANLGTDHGSANNMFLIGHRVRGGHYGAPPSLTALVDGDNMQFTTDFRRVYATAIEGWLGVRSERVLHDRFAPLAALA